MSRNRVYVAIFASFLLATDCLSATVYKSVDKDGRVTYSEQNDAGAVRIEIPVAANTFEAPKREIGPDGKPAETENERIIRRRPVRDETAVPNARRRLDAAIAALDALENDPDPGLWQPLISNAGVGRRRVRTPEFLARNEALTSERQAAESELANAERRDRLGS